MKRAWSHALVWTFVGAVGTTASALSLDELACWAGAGTNRAGLVIVWPVPADPVVCGDHRVGWRARAWGYRWNGRATVWDMVRSVLAADPRLFGVVSAGETNGTALLGLGFDANGNERFGLRGAGRVWLPEAFEGGLLVLAPGERTNLTSLEPGDWFADASGDRGWQAWREPGETGGWLAAPASSDWVRVDAAWAAAELQDGAWLVLTQGDPAEARPPDDIRAAGPPERPFATAVVQVEGTLGSPPYDDPAALLGSPSRWFYDPWATGSGRAAMRRSSLWEAPFYKSSETGSNVLVTLGPGSRVVVALGRPVTNHPAHPYGVDFVVLGNAFFVTGVPMGDEVDPTSVWLGRALFEEPMVVSVSPGYTGRPGEVETDPDTWPWYRYETGPFADTAYPTLGFLWDAAAGRWSEEPTDFTRPVHPRLLEWLADGRRRASEVMSWYAGSGGGTGFDLAESGFDVVRYLKIEGLDPDRAWGEVDAVAAVRMANFGESWLLLPPAPGPGEDGLWFVDPAGWEAGAVEVRVHDLPGPTWARVDGLGATNRPPAAPGCGLIGVEAELEPARDGPGTNAHWEVRLKLPTTYEGDGSDLDVWCRRDGVWVRQSFDWVADPAGIRVSAHGSTWGVWVSRIERPVLVAVRLGRELRLSCRGVAGWRHVLEESLDGVGWSEVDTVWPSEPVELEWRRTLDRPGPVFYRVRLERP
jgi:hypothetical protein